MTSPGTPRRCASLVAVALLCLALVGAGMASAAADVDPFYLQALREGKSLLDRGDYERAVTVLSISCFGLLDDPPKLAEGLVYRALAYAELGQRSETESDMRRVLDIEVEFEAFAQADLTPERRDRFERLVVDVVDVDDLTRSSLFMSTWRRHQSATLRNLSGDTRLSRAEALMRMDPSNVEWPWLAASHELEEGRKKSAAEWVDRTLQVDDLHRPARCARAEMRAETTDCEGMREDLIVCDALPASIEAARDRMRCLVELEDWTLARRLQASLDDRTAADPRVQRFSRRIPVLDSATERDAASDVAAELAGAVSDSGTRVAEDPEESETEPSVDSQERRLLAEANTAMLDARSVADLEAALEGLLPLVEERPGRSDVQRLAGRLAYRLSRFGESSQYFGRVEEDLASSPADLFYYAVSLYETGNQSKAAEVLRRALPGLDTNSTVRAYQEKILGAGKERSGGL